MFGNNQGGLFRLKQNQPIGGGLFNQTLLLSFGQTDATGTGGGLFSNTNRCGGGGLFGGNNQQINPASGGGIFDQGLYGGIFGNTANNQQGGGGLFGVSQPHLFSSKNPNTEQGGGLFNDDKNRGLFGGTVTVPGGNNSNNTQQGNGIFGGASTTTNTARTTSLFGGKFLVIFQFNLHEWNNGGLFDCKTTAFGGDNCNNRQQGIGIFGVATTAANSGSTGLFGSATTTDIARPSLFGNTATKNNGGGLFGCTFNTNNTGGRLYNQPQNNIGDKNRGLFGGTETAFSGNNCNNRQQGIGIFGGSTTAANSGSTGLFGGMESNNNCGGLFGGMKNANNNI
ncbi:hypothetical protein ABPG74_004369 [Tetrahymena malaccensis]